MPVRHDANPRSSLTRISTRIVQIHKGFFGREPEGAKTYLHGDLVVVSMRCGFTGAEETLWQAGRGESLIQQRSAFQAARRPRLIEVIEEELGRKVAGCMNGSYPHPDLLGEVFILEPASESS